MSRSILRTRKRGTTVTSIVCVLALVGLVSCKGSEVLAPAPSALDLDHNAPACSGLSSLTLSSGPALSLIWGEGADDVTDPSSLTYLVYMKVDSGNYNLASPTMIVEGQTSTSITLGITTGHTYTLFVACKDQAGNSYPEVPTNEKSISVTDVTAPTAITDLATSYPTYTTMLLTWSPVNDATSASTITYKIYASTSSSVSTTATPLATVTGTTSYLVSSLNPATTWYYRVVAYDIFANKSSDSNEASGTTVTDSTAPNWTAGNGLAAGTATTTSIPLTWNAATDNVNSSSQIRYKIFRCSGSVTCDPFGGSGTLVTTTTAGATSYSNTGLTPSMVYVFGIRAVDASDNTSTNTDKLVTSTQYSNSGELYIYPTLSEPRILQGSDIAVANVVGTASGAGAYPDLIVGAPLASEPNAAFRINGCFYIYAGTGTGTFATVPSRVICAPNISADGNATNFHFGYAIAASDLDGDGVQDISVSYPVSNIIYFYITTNVSGTLSVPTSANATLTNASGAAYFGTGICVGDLDGVGAEDLVVVSAAQGTGANGQANVYLNTSSGGVFSVPSTTPSATFSPQTAIAAAWPGGLAAGAGEQIARDCIVGKFDVNNPTVTQIVIGSGQAGSAAGNQTDGLIAFYEMTQGTPPTITYVNFLAGATVLGASNTQWGEALAGVQLQPTTTSALKTLAVGAPADASGGNANAGAVYLYSVAKSGGVYTLVDTGRQWFGGGDLNANNFGKAITSAAIWGQTDGSTDMVVSAWQDDQSSVSAVTIDVGDIFTYRNVNEMVSTNVSQSRFDPSSLNASSNQMFGSALCSGDVNNDGRQDLVVGSMNQSYDATAMVSNVANIGAVYIYYGTSTGEIDFAHPSKIIYGPGDQSAGQFGSACVVMKYNDDVYWDLVVGSQGRTVSGTTRGAVYSYWGAASSDLDEVPSDVISGPIAQNTAQFGSALATGDFDENGYADLAVGAMGVNNTTPAFNAAGRVYVYWGTADGIQTIGTPSATAPTELAPPHGGTATASSPTPLTPRVLGSSQHCGNPNFYTGGTRNIANANWNFGSALAAYPTRAKVGAVLGMDLIICAQGATVLANEIQSGSLAVTNEGMCYIYEGSVNKNNSATPPVADISTCATNEIRYDHAGSASFPNQPYNYGSGIAVGKWSGRSNINDLIICASRGRDPDNTNNNAGGCLAYYGLNDGSGNMAGGFQQVSSNNPYQSNRKPPSSSKYIYNTPTQSEVTVANQYSSYGRSVLMLEAANNGYQSLFIGEPNADSRIGISGTTAPYYLGKDSGRVYMLRGGWQQ